MSQNVSVLEGGQVLPILTTKKAVISKTVSVSTTAVSTTLSDNNRDIISIDNQSGDLIYIRWKDEVQTSEATTTDDEWDDVIPTGQRRDYYSLNTITGVSILGVQAGSVFLIQY